MNEEFNKLSVYEKVLATASPEASESAYWKVCREFEDDLLDFPGFPDSYFGFILKLFSDASFYTKKGAWHFLLALGTEQHRLQDKHYKGLADTFVANFATYLGLDELLPLTVCDFIARNYPTSEAAWLFDRLEEIERSKPPEQQGFVQDGRRIMAAEAQRALKNNK